MGNYYLSIIRHYELMSDHFGGTRGYEFYQSAAEAFRAVGLEDSARIYCGIQTWGTPEQIVEKLQARRTLLGDFDLALIAHYGGMPVEQAEQSLRLFAKRVLPALR
jgi:alkanesulfonate monooxygenase SsuD/methylene tetrahydromethanopterin reductase-like flavin-dependent oxidoreductase (luciferase family)